MARSTIALNSGAWATADEVTIPVGHLNVQMMTPQVMEDPGERISQWWGITSSAVALSEYLASIGDLSGQRVIELGCGLGLAGITAGMLGADVLFTDSVPEALEVAKVNTAINGLDPNRTEFRIVDWEQPTDLPLFSMIIGAEILYDYFVHGPLISLVRAILAPRGTIVFADRKRLVVSRFLGRLAGFGFSCREIETEAGAPGFPAGPVSVFILTRK